MYKIFHRFKESLEKIQVKREQLRQEQEQFLHDRLGGKIFTVTIRTRTRGRCTFETELIKQLLAYGATVTTDELGADGIALTGTYTPVTHLDPTMCDIRSLAKDGTIQLAFTVKERFGRPITKAAVHEIAQALALLHKKQNDPLQIL